MAPTAANTGTAGGAGFAGGDISNVSGVTTGILVTYDPFENSEGFRLPMSIGPFWASQGFDFNNRFTNPNNGRSQEESVAFRRTFFGLVMNVSADFVVAKDFRLMPGMLYGMGFADTDPTIDYVVTQNGAVTTYQNKLFDVRPKFGTPYFQVEYRPWNLIYAMPLMFLVGGGFITATTLQWKTEW